MFGSLLTQPLRIATRGVQITVNGAHAAVELVEGLVGLIAARLIGRNGHHAGDGETADTAAWREAAASAASEPAPPAPTPEETAPPAPTPEAPAPAPSLFASTGHIDDEAELVEETADPGAEDGAGAQLRIAEPWDGYRTMKAADIIDRLATASPEELAAVELYELAERNRKSVVAAAQRALKLASRPQS